MKRIAYWKYIWALPGTLLGLLLCAMARVSGGSLSVRDGILEVHGGWLHPILRRFVPLPGGASAMTFGHVIVGRDASALEECRAHEQIHVRQYERWGPLFIPLYLLASLYQILKGRNPYTGNPFEKEAFRKTRCIILQNPEESRRGR